MKRNEIIASNLLDMQAVSLNVKKPYTWASGMLSPIYCDNRLILSDANKRDIVVDAFVACIQENFSDVECIIGTATAGIPWAACIAQKLNLPMGYVRSSHKGHGKGNKVEGRFEAKTKAIVIEDLISTGGSVKDVVGTLREQGIEVLSVIAIFSYQLEKSKECFESLHCNCHVLSDYETLIDIAKKKNYINEEDQEALMQWRANPNDQSWWKG